MSDEKPKRRMGRPPAANRDELQQKVLAFIRLGMSRAKACDAARVPESTARSWESNEQFSREVKAAIAEREALWLTELRKGAPGWQSKAWLLERTNREWAEAKRQVELTGADNGPVSFVFAIVDAATGGDG